jgi:riboflavin biosynthesis pyrimidine reductase
MIESGGSLLTALIAQRLFDELWWVIVPMLIGEPGPSAIRSAKKNSLKDVVWPKSSMLYKPFGDDLLCLLRNLNP